MGTYAVFDEDFQVAVLCGEQLRRWSPKEAAKLALALFQGAAVAREQGHDLTPWRYGLPGDDRINPDDATWLAWELFGLAAELEMLGGHRVKIPAALLVETSMLAEAAGGDGADTVTFLVGDGKLARIAGV